MANDFKMISFDEFENFVRCVDRMLIWVFKYNEKDAIVSEVGVKNVTASERAILG